jgi:hypothetical protein
MWRELTRSSEVRRSDHPVGAENPSAFANRHYPQLVAPTAMSEIESNSVGNGSDRFAVGPDQPSYVGIPPGGSDRTGQVVSTKLGLRVVRRARTRCSGCSPGVSAGELAADRRLQPFPAAMTRTPGAAQPLEWLNGSPERSGGQWWVGIAGGVARGRRGVRRQNPNWPSGLVLLVGARPSSNVAFSLLCIGLCRISPSSCRPDEPSRKRTSRSWCSGTRCVFSSASCTPEFAIGLPIGRSSLHSADCFLATGGAPFWSPPTRCCGGTGMRPRTNGAGGGSDVAAAGGRMRRVGRTHRAAGAR